MSQNTPSRREAIQAATASAILSALPATGHAQENFGHFSGPVQVEFLENDGRRVVLLNDVLYTDQANVQWPVPRGWVVDGASIPQAAWSIIGGPFEGLYRDASVVHDYYCDTKRRPWRDVHAVFYNAMRCRGVGKARALVMYGAVYAFGPRWESINGHGLESPLAAIVGYEAVFSREVRDVASVQNWIESNRVDSPEQIAAFIDSHEVTR